VTSPPPSCVQPDASLARLTTIGTGGPARYLARPRHEDELRACLEWASSEPLPVRVVGLGSNLLVADDGYDGVVLRLEGGLAHITINETRVACGGGASLAAIVRRCTDAGLAGIEFGCAIPGTIGGAVRMNAGAYGSEIRDVLDQAVLVSAGGRRISDAETLALRYRASNVAGDEVVARATLRLRHAPVAHIRAVVRDLQGRRADAQPRKARTFGSVFKNPPGTPTSGQLLEACGLKGFVIGGARISPKHANFIENMGAATSLDVAALIAEARRRARARFGVELEHEVELLGRISIPD
jgi:UDP-N-acetylenolpyruvoylglucosamine reductase